MRPHLALAPAVAAALACGRPVVALESAIITHGLPPPQNLAVAHAAEEAVRSGGAEPATIAVLDGSVHVGCTAGELERLAAAGAEMAKVSLRDLPVLVARGGSGGTTVAATATLAAAAGIPVFATGGIGGVHRGAGRTWDLSADLTVLGRAPTCVVCAGAKIVLDIPATIEVLETLGVTVVGYRTDRFPGFYVAETPHPVDLRCETPAEVAAVVRSRRALDLPGGVLVVQQVAAASALDVTMVEACMAEALAAAGAAGIQGKALTPFLLRRLSEATGGRSLAANATLVQANAALAAEIAAALDR